jgi:hypothetical protein
MCDNVSHQNTQHWQNKAAILHDPGIEPLFSGVNMNVLVEFLTSIYYTFQYLVILMLLEPFYCTRSRSR